MEASKACEQVIKLAKDHNLAVVLRGIPGSGKSYFKGLLDELTKESKITYSAWSADDYFMKENGYHFNPSHLQKAHTYCQEKFKEALDLKTRLVLVDNTNTQHWEYEPYLRAAQRFDYKVQIVEMECENVIMAQKFAKRNCHGVSISKVIMMYDRWEDDDSALLVQPGILEEQANADIPDYSAARYTGIFLTKESQKLLKKKIPPKFKEVHSDHVTLQFLPSRESVLDLPFGEKCDITVIGTAQDDKGQAAVVEINNSTVTSSNKYPHITISVDANVGAGYSNELLASGGIIHLKEKFLLQGVIGIKLKTENNGLATVTKAPKRLVYAGMEYVLNDAMETQHEVPEYNNKTKPSSPPQDIGKEKKRRNRKQNKKGKDRNEERTSADGIDLRDADVNNEIGNLLNLSLQEASSSPEQAQPSSNRSIHPRWRRRQRKNSDNGENKSRNQKDAKMQRSAQNDSNYGEESKDPQVTKGKSARKQASKNAVHSMQIDDNNPTVRNRSDLTNKTSSTDAPGGFRGGEPVAEGKGRRNRKKKSHPKSLAASAEPIDCSSTSNLDLPLQESEQLREPTIIEGATIQHSNGKRKVAGSKSKQDRKQAASTSIKGATPVTKSGFLTKRLVNGSAIDQRSLKKHNFDDRKECLLCEIDMN